MRNRRASVGDEGGPCLGSMYSKERDNVAVQAGAGDGQRSLVDDELPGVVVLGELHEVRVLVGSGQGEGAAAAKLEVGWDIVAGRERGGDGVGLAEGYWLTWPRYGLLIPSLLAAMAV